MESRSFDRVARLFAERKLTRRTAIAQGATGLAAAALAGQHGHAGAQDATPAAEPGETPSEGRVISTLFVQSFQSGGIVPKEGEADTFTLTLEQGLGQTIYFSDRPDRTVGATPTPDFLDGLGFGEDNPPNAALVVSGPDGTTDIAVVELFNPTYETVNNTATYDIKVLADWQQTVELGFTEAPTDLSAMQPQFGSAHLFIDDCSDRPVSCVRRVNPAVVGHFPWMGYCWEYSTCRPCEPYYKNSPDWYATGRYWDEKCNRDFSQCNGQCYSAWGLPPFE